MKAWLNSTWQRKTENRRRPDSEFRLAGVKAQLLHWSQWCYSWFALAAQSRICHCSFCGVKQIVDLHAKDLACFAGETLTGFSFAISLRSFGWWGSNPHCSQPRESFPTPFFLWHCKTHLTFVSSPPTLLPRVGPPQNKWNNYSYKYIYIV